MPDNLSVCANIQAGIQTDLCVHMCKQLTRFSEAFTTCVEIMPEYLNAHVQGARQRCTLHCS